MIEYVESFLCAMRPAFSRQATFVWFVVAFAGFILRTDNFGVSSIVRTLWLAPACYPCLLHFFHSSAWQVETLLRCWWKWLGKEKAIHLVFGRNVILGDHTKTPKDGRRMPAVCTLHQDSETSSKPTFFRGHHWGCLSLLVRAGNKFFSTPLWAEIHQNSLEESRATRLVSMAINVAQAMEQKCFLVLDAFFAVGPVFLAAARVPDLVHILTRAKKNVVAYLPPPKQEKPRRGPKRIYGEKLKLMELFDSWADKFKTDEVDLYQGKEMVRYLKLDLLWKPTKGLIRFILIESSRGRIILMTSDLTLEPLTALFLYCRRVTIETMFDTLKNILGGMGYHFWSKYLKPVSRRPTKDGKELISSRPSKTKRTLEAIEKFLNLQLLVLGVLRLTAIRFASQIEIKARCWLRTPCRGIPSEFVTQTAISNIIRANLFDFGKDMITQLISQKQKNDENACFFRKAA